MTKEEYKNWRGSYWQGFPLRTQETEILRNRSEFWYDNDLTKYCKAKLTPVYHLVSKLDFFDHFEVYNSRTGTLFAFVSPYGEEKDYWEEAIKFDFCSTRPLYSSDTTTFKKEFVCAAHINAWATIKLFEEAFKI